MYKFTRFLSVFFIGVLVVSGDVFGAGYTCPTYKKYTSCAEGYYMTQTSSSTACYPTPKTANACRPCSVYGSGYTCNGGTSCPYKASGIVRTCEAGYYLPGGSMSCVACKADSYCPGGTYQVSMAGGEDQGIKPCPQNYPNGPMLSSSIKNCYVNVPAGNYIPSEGADYDSCPAGSAKGAHRVNYGSTSSCDVCGINKYSDSGASSCTSCVSGYTNSGDLASDHAGEESCKISCLPGTYVATKNGSCVTVGPGYWGEGGEFSQGTTGGRNQCPYKYQDGPAATAKNRCYASVPAGSYVSEAESGYFPKCDAGTYKEAHNVYYGDTSSCKVCGDNSWSDAGAGSCSPCAPGYTNSGSLATDHDYDFSCEITCAAGTYVEVEGGKCVSVGDGYYSDEKTVTYGNTSSRLQCPSAYRDGPAASSINGCSMNVPAGNYVRYASSSSYTECSNWTYKEAHSVKYGEKSTCDSCPASTSGWTKGTGTGWTSYTSCYQTKEIGGYCSSGSLKQTAASPSSWGNATIEDPIRAEAGAYVDDTTCRQCSGAKYSEGGTVTSCTPCPNATSGWTLGTGIGWESYSQCYQIKDVGGYCKSGTLKKVASSPSSWSSSTTVLVALMAEQGAYVSGQTCKQCSGAEYSAGGNVTSCKSCPAQTTGWTRGTGTGWSSYSQCYQTKDAGGYCSAGSLKQNASSASSWGSTTVETPLRAEAGAYVDGTTCSACKSGSYCTGGTSSPTSCSTVGNGFYPNSDAGASSQSECYTDTLSGQIVKRPYESFPTDCPNWTYKGEHTVYYGSSSTCVACPLTTGGWNRGTGTGWSSYTQCYQTKDIGGYCSAGSLQQNATGPSSWGPSEIGERLEALPGAYVNGTTCSRCSSGYYCIGGTNSQFSCRTIANGFYPNSNAGASSESDCYTNTLSGQYVATANATSATTCPNWTYKNGHTVNYGDTSSCYNCPPVSNGWTKGTGTGWTLVSSCYQTKEVGGNCSAGSIKQTAVSSNMWGEITEGDPLQAKPGAFVDGDTCTVCGNNTYSLGGTVNSCTSCPGSYTTTGSALTSHDQKSDCKITCSAGTRVASVDEACTTPSGSWYTYSHTVSAGNTSGFNVQSCISGYTTPNSFSAYDHDDESDCTIYCEAGTQIVSVNATSCTTPAGNWYVGAHSVGQGQTSVVSSCLLNYKTTGTNAANHDAESDCKISCGGGTYIENARDTSCTDVGVGNWAAASTVSQGSKGVLNACPAGLTTIGYGAGADEAGDCGRILHLGDSKIYLRSDKKTPTALNVGIDGQVFYGNMDTATRGTLRIKSGGTTYSVYDDSML